MKNGRRARPESLSRSAETPGTVRQSDRHTTTAVDVWRAITNRALARLEEMSVQQRELGLSPGHVRALLVVESSNPRPMRWYAEHLGVDASTVTWIMDRLEEKGLVERKPLGRDRRIKTLELTPLGRRTKALVEATFFAPPRRFDQLPPEILEALHGAIDH